MFSGRRARCLAAAIAAMGLGCTAPAAADRCPEISASAPIVAAPTIASAARPRARDPAERALEDSAIVALKPAAGLGPSAGIFVATLAEAAGSAGSATLTLALASAPTAYRRPLAYARLAAALGMHVVPAAVERHLGAGEIAALLEPYPGLAALLATRLRVLNDGTVTALLSAPAPGSRGEIASAVRVEARESFEVRTWARWAASPAPAADERPLLTRDFVEMLALDYLAANVTRRTLLRDRDRGRDALVLDDNREAFPQGADRLAVDRLLQRLRPVARFPRGLRDALVAFDQERARQALTPGAFEGWLVSPRALIELDERRAGLLSLVEARIAERGEAAVLSL
jgi:hypothetical protein